MIEVWLFESRTRVVYSAIRSKMLGKTCQISIQRMSKKHSFQPMHWIVLPPHSHTRRYLSKRCKKTSSPKQSIDLEMSPPTARGAKEELSRTGLNCQPLDSRYAEANLTVERASQLRHGRCESWALCGCWVIGS